MGEGRSGGCPNWHRPLSVQLRALLDHGLALRAFDELPLMGPPDRAAHDARIPSAMTMTWEQR